MDAEALRIYSVRQNGLKGDPILRLILVGDAGVGKSSLLFQYADGMPVTPENYLPTIGVDFRYKTIQIQLDKGTQPVKLQLWDTAGHERYRSITTSYYRSADAVVLLYDITNRASFLNVRHWIDVVENAAGRRPIYMIVGNKTDLEEKREVPQAEAAAFAEAMGAGFTEVSLLEAKDRDANLVLLFELVAKMALEQRVEKAAMQQRDAKVIRLTAELPTVTSPLSSPKGFRSFFSGYC